MLGVNIRGFVLLGGRLVGLRRRQGRRGRICNWCRGRSGGDGGSRPARIYQRMLIKPKSQLLEVGIVDEILDSFQQRARARLQRGINGFDNGTCCQTYC
jgi:hypothetical protein